MFVNPKKITVQRDSVLCCGVYFNNHFYHNKHYINITMYYNLSIR